MGTVIKTEFKPYNFRKNLAFTLAEVKIAERCLSFY